MSNLFVVGMGVGTVFLGLVCIVLLCLIMSAICRAAEKKPDAPIAQPVSGSSAKQIENRQEIIAAGSAAVAEELGTDISAIRIHSFKKI